MVGSGPRVKVMLCTWRLVGRCVMACYDVALWRWWPALFPEWVGLVDAPNAFAAVGALMHACGLRWVAYASVRRVDGSLLDRACGVWLCPEVGDELTAEEWAAFG